MIDQLKQENQYLKTQNHSINEEMTKHVSNEKELQNLLQK